MAIKYGIEINGEMVKHVVFLGGEENLYREHVVELLLFDNENSALETASVWSEAQVVEVKNNLLVA